MTAIRKTKEAFVDDNAMPEDLLARATPSRVVTCYTVLDHFMRMSGITDLTEGVYGGDPTRDYEEAQAAQARLLLDRTELAPGQRLLDIGCGYGRILRTATARGLEASGLTVSPEQAASMRAAGLDAHLLDYRHLPASWHGRFDGVVANGSLEHFAQCEDAVAGNDDRIYRHFFETVHGLLRRPNGRLVTTAIHFAERPDPKLLLQAPTSFPRGSHERHFANLRVSMGGWYPVPGQLERCAAPFFELVDDEDGTEDYRITSDHWLGVVRGHAFSLRGFPIWRGLAALAMRNLEAVVGSVRCLQFDESWNWQFRGERPPTRLARQIWRRRP